MDADGAGTGAEGAVDWTGAEGAAADTEGAGGGMLDWDARGGIAGLACVDACLFSLDFF